MISRLLRLLRELPDALIVAAWLVGLVAVLALGQALRTGAVGWLLAVMVLAATTAGLLCASRTAWSVASTGALVAVMGALQRWLAPAPGDPAGSPLSLTLALALCILLPLWLPSTLRYVWVQRAQRRAAKGRGLQPGGPG